MDLLAPMYSVKLVRNDVERENYPKMGSPGDVRRLVREILLGKDRECVLVVMLSAEKRVIGTQIVSVGAPTATVYRCADVYKPAILHGADSIVVAHNHPMCPSTPSDEDILSAFRVVQAGILLGIPCHDAFIVGEDGVRSMRDEGDLEAVDRLIEEREAQRVINEALERLF